MKANSKTISKCQIAGTSDLKSIMFFGYLPPPTEMKKINSRIEEKKFYPANLVYSNTSKLVQLNTIVKKEILFPRSYAYTSSTTKILRDNFKELSEEVFNKFKIDKEDLIIDIGSNDGNLLSNFLNKTRVLGVTPEDIGQLAIEKGIPTILDYFTPTLSKNIKNKYGLAKIITAANVFAHMDNIGEILNSVVDLLKDDGIFISESHYLLSLIEENQYDTIYHEHLRYYSLSSLDFLFKKHDMEIIGAKRINTHGGSIRVYAGKKNRHKIDNSFLELIDYENKELFSKDLFNFKNKVVNSKLKLYSLLKEIINNGFKIYGISAPSRSTTLINYVGINADIMDCILEVDGSQKINHYLPGTDIPILNEKKLYLDQPEYALILSWHISDELINSLRKKGYKGKFIIPLPEPNIVD